MITFNIHMQHMSDKHLCPEEAHLFVHHVPVPLFDAWITQSINQRHVNLECLQPRFNFNGCCLRSPEVWVSKLFGQLVCCLPQVLNLKYFRFHKYEFVHILSMNKKPQLEH